MYCEKCGKQLPDDSLFCEYCGSTVSQKAIKQHNKNMAAEQKRINARYRKERSNEIKQELDEKLKKILASLKTFKTTVTSESFKQEMSEKREKVKDKVKENSHKAKEFAANTINETGKLAGEGVDKFKKADKKPLIIRAAVLAAVIIAVTAFSLLVPRSANKSALKLSDALKSGNEKRIVKLMFPGNKYDKMDKWLKNNSKELRDFVYASDNLSILSGSRYSDLSASVEKLTDQKYKEAFDNFLADAKIKISYDNLSKVTVSGSSGTAETTSMLGYSVGNKWYLFPGFLEYIGKGWKDADVENADKIAKAVEEAINSDDNVYASMLPYSGAPIDISEDLDYLPQIFKDKLLSILGNVPELNSTIDGEMGYTFRWYKNDSSVYVYISNEADMCEWQVYPEYDERYYTGEAYTGYSRATSNSDYRYVRLISPKSDFIGYWQGDDTAMYIGYDISGGGEGFTVYLLVDDSPQIINERAGYSQSGETSKISYVKTTDWENITTDINVTDTEHLTVHISGVKYDEEIDKSYSYTRGEIGRDVLDKYVGNWIYHSSVVFDRFEILKGEVVYDDGCKAIYSPEDAEQYKNNPFVTLYNGMDRLEFIFPEKGLADADNSRRDWYILENENEGVCSIRGSMTSVDGYVFMYRDGSKEAGIIEVMSAYRKYTEPFEDNYYCSLVYIDDDDIPECVINTQGDTYVLTYHDGEVVDICDGADMATVYYNERSGLIKFEGSAGATTYHAYYTLKDGVFECQGTSDADVWTVVSPDDEQNSPWRVNDKEVSEKKYNEFEGQFGAYDDSASAEYSSIYEAYQDLTE